MSTVPQNVAEGVAEIAGAAYDHVTDLVDRSAEYLDDNSLGDVAGDLADRATKHVERALEGVGHLVAVPVPVASAAPEPPRRHRGRWLVIAGVAVLTVGWVVVSRRRAVARSAAALDDVVDLRDAPVTAPGAMNGRPDGAATSPFEARPGGSAPS